MRGCWKKKKKRSFKRYAKALFIPFFFKLETGGFLKNPIYRFRFQKNPSKHKTKALNAYIHIKHLFIP